MGIKSRRKLLPRMKPLVGGLMSFAAQNILKRKSTKFSSKSQRVWQRWRTKRMKRA
jgi:hypothetical protein